MGTTITKKTTEAGEKLIEIGNEIAAEATHLKDYIAGNYEERMGVARDATKRAIKAGRKAAGEAIEDAEYQVKKHPFQSVGLTFGIGLALGVIIGLLATRDDK